MENFDGDFDHSEHFLDHWNRVLTPHFHWRDGGFSWI